MLPQLVSGSELTIVAFVLAALAVWIALAVWAVLTLRRAGRDAVKGALWGCGLAISGAVLAGLAFDRVLTRNLDSERSAVEARATALVARAIAPGSALTCLDALSSAPVESACEKALFGSSEQVAAALAYVNAQLSLLASSAALAERDPSYRPAAERLRRGLEEDRYGLVAHVLSTRGCASTGCPDFAMLRDRTRIVANMQRGTFAAMVDSHAQAWNSAGGAPALAAAVAPMPEAADGAQALAAGTAHRRYDFPSSESIPPVSIIATETDGPLGGGEPAKRAARPRSARAPAPAPAAAAPAVSAPTSIVPGPAQTSGQR